MLNYRLIALDVDGTLLNDDYELTENTIKTLHRIHKAGGSIVLCTGRGPVSTIPVLEQLGLEGVLITHNGAATVEAPGPKLLHQFSFDIQDVEPMISYCRKQNIHFDVCTALDMYVEKMGEREASMYKKYMIIPKHIDDLLALPEQIVKLTLFGSEEEMDRAEQDLNSASLPQELHWIRSGVEFIDIMLHFVSKGEALRQLAEQWHIPSSEIIAIGNYYNDIDMIRFAGLGIAMDNSPEAVKKAANQVTLSNNEEGVHQALLQYVLSPSCRKLC